jgi:hypothetical protein
MRRVVRRAVALAGLGMITLAAAGCGGGDRGAPVVAGADGGAAAESSDPAAMARCDAAAESLRPGYPVKETVSARITTAEGVAAWREEVALAHNGEGRATSYPEQAIASDDPTRLFCVYRGTMATPRLPEQPEPTGASFVIGPANEPVLIASGPLERFVGLERGPAER